MKKEENMEAVVIKYQIAPKREEVKLTESAITTDWNGGITFECGEAGMRALLCKYNPDYIRDVFIGAIAMSSKRWQVKELISRTLEVDGEIK